MFQQSVSTPVFLEHSSQPKPGHSIQPEPGHASQPEPGHGHSIQPEPRHSSQTEPGLLRPEHSSEPEHSYQPEPENSSQPKRTLRVMSRCPWSLSGCVTPSSRTGRGQAERDESRRPGPRKRLPGNPITISTANPRRCAPPWAMAHLLGFHVPVGCQTTILCCCGLQKEESSD